MRREDTIIKKEKQFVEVVCENCEGVFSVTNDYLADQLKAGKPIICPGCLRTESNIIENARTQDLRANRKPLNRQQKQEIVIWAVITLIICFITALILFVWPTKWSPLRVFPAAIAVTAIFVLISQIKDIRNGFPTFFSRRRAKRNDSVKLHRIYAV